MKENKLKISIPVSRLLLISVGLIFCSISLAQPLVVNKVKWEGQKRSKPFFLQQHVNTKIGDILSIDRLERDVQNLQNLTAVSTAIYIIDSIQNKAVVTYQIQEAMTFFPAVNLGTVRDNFWFGLGFTELNWRGRGQELSVFYRNVDRRHNASLYFRLPNINGSNWGTSLALQRWASVEPLYFSDDQTVFYQYTNPSVGATAIYHLQRDYFIEFGGTYFVEEYAKDERHFQQSTPGPDYFKQPKGLLKFIHNYRRIDYDLLNLEGFDQVSTFQSVYNFGYDDWFHIFLHTARYFKRFGKNGNLATRLRLGISTNNESPFAPFVLDSYLTIRGSGNRIDRGTAQIVLNLEYRQTLFELDLFAAQAVIFSDAGTWRQPGGDWTDLNNPNFFRQFVGGGIRLIYKRAFNSMIRIDYGVDIFNTKQRGFVIGTGQYF